MLEKHKYETAAFVTLATVFIVWDSVAPDSHDWGERLFGLLVILIAITSGSLIYRMSHQKN